MKRAWLIPFACAVTWLSVAGGVCAEEFSLSTLRRIEVPADQPTLWPRWERPLLAVPRDEFERLLEAARPPVAAPPTTVIEHAVYEATLVGDTWQGGKLQLGVRRLTPQPVWQRFAPWNVALTGLMWSDGEAIAGTAPDGQCWLWNDRQQGELVGGWSARGRSVADSVDFDLQLPAAVSTTLRLRVPPGSLLTAEPSLARRLESGTAFDLWEVDVAEQPRCHLRVARPQRGAKVTPLVSFRQELTAEVREDHLRFQMRFHPEVWGGEIRELRFSVPSSVELYAVGMGPETKLAWTRDATPGPRQIVRVELPEPMRGTLRPLILEGIVGSRPSASTVIPQLELVEGLFLAGRQTITVMRPLQIVSMRMTGCRQGAPLLAAADSETLTVEQLLPDALLNLDLRRPPSTASGQLLSEIDLRDEVWTQTTHVLWSTNSGSAFQAAWRVPAGWDVTDVDAFNSAGGVERTTWERSEESGGATQLRIEFFQAITAGQPRRLRILSRRRALEAGGLLDSPIPTPLEGGLQDAVVRVRARPRFRASLTGETAFSEIGSDDLTRAWWRQPEWNSTAGLPDEDELWLRGSDLSRFGGLRLEPEPAAVAAQVETHVEVSLSAVVERYRLTIRPTSGPCDRLLVWLSEAGAEVTWHIDSPAGLQTIARRLPGEQLPLWELPLEGDLWELRLPPTDAAELTIVGERTRTQSLPGRAGLVFLPQAETLAGVVEFQSKIGELELLPRGLAAVERETESAAKPAAVVQWRYQTPTAELRWVSRATPRVQLATTARMEVQTLVSAAEEPFDYHRAECRLPPHGEMLQVRFPTGCEPLTAALDGVNLGRVTDGLVEVPATASAAGQRLVLTYRTPTQAGFLSSLRSVPAPTCSAVLWNGFRWEFSLPSTARLWSEPAGVRLSQPLVGPSWTERLFGPFGRSARESIFWPWSVASWTELTAPSARVPTVTSVGDPAWTAPPGWQNFVAYAPEPPAQLQFHIWRGDRIQLLSWIGVLASLTFGVGLRRAGWVLRDQATVLWMAILLAASFALDPPLTDLVGGLWTGTVISVLLPRRWLLPGPVTTSQHELRPVGSTQSFNVPPPLSATTLLLIAVGLSIGPRSQAQDAAPARQAEAKHFVLVPVDRDGRPSKKLPLVYTSEAVLQGLRAAAEKHIALSTPPYVFPRAVYRLKLGPESPATVFAAYDVVVAGPENSALIQLPLRGNGLSVSACRVDGHPAVLTATPDGSGFQVTIVRPEAPVSAVGEQPITRHTVMLDVNRPWQREPQLAAVTMQIPAVHEARVIVEGATAPQALQLPFAAGRRSPPEATSTTLIEYGPVGELTAEWSTPTSGAKRPVPEIQLETGELLAVGPNAIQSRTKSVVVPVSGSLRRLTVKLPPQAVLQDLQLVPAGGFQQRTDAAGGAWIDLEFAEELHEPAIVRCQYVVPKPSQQLEFMWHGLAWSSPDPATWTTKQRILAAGSSSELRVQPQSLQDSGLVPLTLDAARDFLADLIVDVRPRELYQVGVERPIPFRTTRVPLQRRVSQWRQQGVLRKDRLTWTMDAALEPTTTPVYAHVLLADRRLQIESVSVRERNAARTLRWSEARPLGSTGINRVTVFLTDPMTDAQQLSVTASLPVSAAGPLSLPSIKLEDAEISSARLDLAADPLWQLEWSSLRGLKRILRTSEATPAEGGILAGVEAAWPTWEYEVQDPDWRANVRLRLFHENSAIRAVHVLIHESTELLELHSRLELPALDRSAPVGIALPSPWELQAIPHVPGLQVETVRDDQQAGTLLTLTPTTSGPVTLRWQARAAWTDFPNGECTLPSVRGTSNRDVRTWIAEVAPPPLAPRLKPLVGLNEVAPPEWAVEWLTELAPMAPGHRWLGELAEDDSRWPLERAPETNSAAVVTWLEHRLWRRRGQSDAGQTLVRLQTPLRTLTVAAPADIEIVSALVDGRMAALLVADEREHRVAAIDGQPFQEAWISWRSRADSPVPWSGLVESVWPSLPQAEIVQQAVTIFPADGEIFWPLRGWAKSDWVDRTLLRLESLSDAWWQSAAAARSEFSEARLRQGYAVAAEKLTPAADALNERQPQRRERWKSVVERVNQLPATAPAAVSAAAWQPSLEDLLADHPSAEYGMLPPSANQTWSWRFEERSQRVLLACLLFLGAMFAARIVVSSRWRERLRARPNGAAALLGLLWWLCLTPSILGLALLAWAAYRALTTVQRRPTAVGVTTA